MTTTNTVGARKEKPRLTHLEIDVVVGHLWGTRAAPDLGRILGSAAWEGVDLYDCHGDDVGAVLERIMPCANCDYWDDVDEMMLWVSGDYFCTNCNGPSLYATPRRRAKPTADRHLFDELEAA